LSVILQVREDFERVEATVANPLQVVVELLRELAAGEPPVQRPALAASSPNEALDSASVASGGRGYK
jgi:hypothetical protein